MASNLAFFVHGLYNFCMSNGDVQFDVDALQHSSYEPKEPKLVQWVINHSGGLIKNETLANYALLAFAALMVSLSVYIFIEEGEKPYQPSQEETPHVITATTPNPPIR